MNTTLKTVKKAADKAKAAGAEHIGDFVAWDTADVDVPRAALRKAFDSVGFGDLLGDIDPDVALSRARVRHNGRDLVARAIQKTDKDATAAVAISKVVERDGEQGQDLVLGARCRSVGGVIYATPRPDGTSDPECMKRADEIAEAANHMLSHVPTAEMTAATIAACRKIGGVSVRESRGGCYFVPAIHAERWRKLITALSEVCGNSFRPVLFDIYDTPMAKASVAQSAKSAFETELAELTEELEKAKADGFGRRNSFVTRIEACEQLVSRVELYRSVLADAADKLAARSALVKAGLAAELDAFDLGKRPSKDSAD